MMLLGVIKQNILLILMEQYKVKNNNIVDMLDQYINFYYYFLRS